MLSRPQIERLVSGEMPDSAVVELLTQLKVERITPTLLNLFLDVIAQTNVTPVQLIGPVFDCCGTGGSGLPHYNISTAVAFVLAAGGVPVAKFGNRGMSNAHGSADFLEHLKIPLQLSPRQIDESFEKTGLVFLFAPQFYPALGRLAPLRKSLGFKTVFNFLGPLLNPARPTHRLVGISDELMQGVLAEYLETRPENRRALVVRGENGLDEFVSPGVTQVYEVTPGQVRREQFQSPYRHSLPANFVISLADNLRCFHQLIERDETERPYNDLVLLNAGAGFYAAEKVSSIEEGCCLAEQLVAQGLVKAKFQEYQALHV